MKILSFFVQVLIVGLLTMITQIGGIIWLITIIIFSSSKFKKKFRILTFFLLYLSCTVFVVPSIAKQNGRIPLPMDKKGLLVPHNYMTVLLNRHYVKKRLYNELQEVAKDFSLIHNNARVVYLDANFPFIDRFPLLPHRSHNDGRKIDISFMYKKNGKPVNGKPSRSGYGYYESPKVGEYDKPKECMKRGFWQYDFPQYLTLGSSDKYVFDEERTRDLIQIILSRSTTHKVFIEPHLKSRLNVVHKKCRYHGCRAVRHDDHIHYQIK